MAIASVLMWDPSVCVCFDFWVRPFPSVTGGGEIPRGDFSAGKIPYFNLVRNFPLIFRGEVRNFPRAEFCPCKPPYHRMPCASPRAPICFVPALLQLLSTNREGGAGSRIICEWRATPSTEVISGTMVIAFSQDLLGIAIPGSLLLPMHCRFGRCGIFPLIFWTGAEFSPCGIFPCGKIPVQNFPPPCMFFGYVRLRCAGIFAGDVWDGQ